MPRPRNSKTAPPKPGHNPSADEIEGEKLRRLEFCEFCFQQHTLGFSQREIATKLAEAFMLERKPTHVTVAGYIRGAVKLRNRKITEMREEWLGETMPRLEAMLNNFLPIATNSDPGRPLKVLRRERFKGEYIEVIDADAFKEQKEAAEVVLKTIEQARKILGVGAEKDGGDGEPVNAERITSIVFNTVQQNFTGPAAKQAIGPLALNSGDPALDALEGGSGGSL